MHWCVRIWTSWLWAFFPSFLKVCFIYLIHISRQNQIPDFQINTLKVRLPHLNLHHKLSLQQLFLVALEMERQGGQGSTLETLVFLMWLASGSAYGVVSRDFDRPLLSVHRVSHRTVGEMVAVLSKFVCLRQWFSLAGLAGAIDSSHIRIMSQLPRWSRLPKQ